MGALQGRGRVRVEQHDPDGGAPADRCPGRLGEALAGPAGEQVREGVEHFHDIAGLSHLLAEGGIVEAEVLPHPVLLQPGEERLDDQQRDYQRKEFRGQVEQQVLPEVRHAAGEPQAQSHAYGEHSAQQEYLTTNTAIPEHRHPLKMRSYPKRAQRSGAYCTKSCYPCACQTKQEAPAWRFPGHEGCPAEEATWPARHLVPDFATL